jgi:hypothetical protein
VAALTSPRATSTTRDFGGVLSKRRSSPRFNGDG